MAEFFVQTRSAMPDFRLVISFLWGDFHDVDTDGDSYNPASREWTELYCANRENPAEVFDITPVRPAKPPLLMVNSDDEGLAARVAYFLSTETNGQVSENAPDSWGEPRELLGRLGAFDLIEAKSRARKSCWRWSSLDNPYPNLDDGLG